MYQSASVEFDFEVERSYVHIRAYHLATLLVLGVALDVHDAVKARIPYVDIHLDSVSQAVDNHVRSGEVSSGKRGFCRISQNYGLK